MIRPDTLAELLKFGTLLAHQIKNPLTSLTLQIDELSEQLVDSNLVKVTEDALKDIQQINFMIERIFELWKMSLNHELETFDFTELVKTVIKKWQGEFNKFGRVINLIGPERILALGCAELESQVIDILIDNSLKYGAGETLINLHRNTSWAVLTIKDQGFGINEKIKDKLMTFGATTTGNGIGLVWAKNQVINDGGKLEITNLNPAVFTLSLLLDPINYGLNQLDEH